ncbi:S8 family peptidase [Pseudomonas sp. A-R-19]|uniref:S8 family peptidase n=1 Tax=Pseudomonas sp. A-R-19 TaxID=2832403 RepID=UPI001CBE950B|nr:S8 family peptidase [Pseudomonas sp. A-R-19]
MKNNPVQVVLNTQNYVTLYSRQGGGGDKDFYAGRDIEFVEHKTQLLQELKELSQMAGGSDELIYAQVELQSLAWAKSHRPIKRVFKPGEVVVKAGISLGSIVIGVKRSDIESIGGVISSAEEKTNYVQKNNKEVAKPSRVRSEIGAIKSIRHYSAHDKRKFSLEDALRWLKDPRTGGVYYIETFLGNDYSKYSKAEASSKINFVSAVRHIDGFEIIEIESDLISSLCYMARPRETPTSPDAHRGLLNCLEQQEVVKSIILPPVLQASVSAAQSAELDVIKEPDADIDYPIVGIIDTGAGNLKQLEGWRAGGADYLEFEFNQDYAHGTFIAGLISGGDSLNSYQELQEGACKFYDLDLHPTNTANYGSYYPNGFIDFLEQLDLEVIAAKEKGVRVFNMSLAVVTCIQDSSYSMFANIIDSIADKHDIVFVLPTGNLDQNLFRDEWTTDPVDNLAMLASYKNQGLDRIFQPADSIRSVVVGALNPPDNKTNVFPSVYTRRGPGPSFGMKPDVAHIGGAASRLTGLRSLAVDGSCVHSCGTSYASPLVAKTLANIHKSIEGDVSRETLIALLLHHAKVPSYLLAPELSKIYRDFVGVGIPSLSSQTMLSDDYEITLVFSGVMYKQKQLEFNFAWPADLVNENGGCSGDVKMTVVHRPPVDRDQSAEFVRLNIDAFLRQAEFNKRTKKTSFKGHLKNECGKFFEKELVEHGSKWWPTKRLIDTFDNVGASSQWRLVLQPLTRSEFEFPQEGVPFCVILTISDPGKKLPIFNNMKLQLQASGATLSDIRSSVRPRVRR